MDTQDDALRRLLSDKSDKLEELKRQKLGQQGYRRSLKAFLEADAAVQKALLAQFEERSWRAGSPPAELPGSGH
jgi:hypothetical protein